MTRWARAADIARRVPATLGLLVALTGVLLLEHLSGGSMNPDTLLRWGAGRADLVWEQGETWRLLTPMLLHAGPVHLLLNGFALAQLGVLVELLWGSRKLVLFFVVTGFVGGLFSLGFGDPPLTVGASGAVLGLAGVLLGAYLFGDEPVQDKLAGLAGPLWRSVGVTFALGLALTWLQVVGVDNWAHFGGFACGLLVGWGYPDPSADDDAATTSLAGGSLVALVVAAGLAAWEGPQVLEPEGRLVTARRLGDRVSAQPGSWSSLPVLVSMLEGFEAAGAPDEGLERFGRGVAKVDEPDVAERLALIAYLTWEKETGAREDAVGLALERWVALAPGEPNALNTLAWFLVDRPTAERRDPGRAAELSTESLARLPKDDDTSRSAYLDTKAQALFQLGRLEDALATQQEAVRLAEQEGLAELPELHERLAKIEASR